MAETDWLIVGLGNPGKKYEVTRHNIGFLVVKALARKQGWNFKEERSFNAYVSKNLLEQQTVHLLLPTTYMNHSGMALRRYLDYYKVPLQQVIVVADDIALDYGAIRVRPGGSAGGHNGLKSIQEHLGTQDYARLRMGIGDHRQAGEADAGARMSLADYVLGGFNREEVANLEEFIDRGAQVLMRLLKEPIVSIMNTANMKRIQENPQTKGQEKKHEST